MIDLVWNLGSDSLTLGMFLDKAAGDGLSHSAFDSWTTGLQLADIDVALMTSSVSHAHGWQATFERDVDCRIYVSIDHELANVMVVAGRLDAAQDGLTYARTIVTPGNASTPEQIPVTFWAYTPRGQIQMRRNLDAPTWEEIADNYADGTREELERMMRSFEPGRGGQLVLWSGKPGTGKTTAIRALAREWRDWMELHYVTDPDKFFGAEADYMLGVLLDNEQTFTYSSIGMPAIGRKRDPWRVLLLEDSGELLSADARAQTGQGLSRFLNAVDGLIGQGLRILVLVTSNEDMRKLNPAVARPGRCASHVEFGAFDKQAAQAWLLEHLPGDEGDHRIVAGVDGSMTLAELYAALEGFTGQRLSHSFGFNDVSAVREYA